MKNQSFFIVVIVLGMLSGLWWAKRIVWTGFYYSDIDRMEDQQTWTISPPLWSLKQCRDWVNAVHKEGDNYDYECGQGCRFTVELGGITICRITKE